MTPKNYDECSRVFSQTSLDYVDLQNLINFRLLNENAEKLEDWLNESEKIPNLESAIVYQLLRRGIHGYKILW